MLTGGGGHTAGASHTFLFHGMEICFQIPDERSVDRTMTHGLETVNYVSQMHRVSSALLRGLFVCGLYVFSLRFRSPFPFRTHAGYRLLSATPTVLIIHYTQWTRCPSQLFGRYAFQSKVETTSEAWLRLPTRSGPLVPIDTYPSLPVLVRK